MYIRGDDMTDIVLNPVCDVFEQWSEGVRPIVGDGNYSMDGSQTIAPTKKLYARLMMIDNPTTNSDLEGDECATTPTFQVDVFASGSKSSSKVYEIDNASHRSMVSMGFKRVYGPSWQNNIDNNIKRMVSRYSRVYTGKLL